MNENILKIIEKIKSIFGESIFHEKNKKQLISAVKDFAEDYEDEEFLVEAIENDDYEDGISSLLNNDFGLHQENSNPDFVDDKNKNKVDEAALKKIKKFLKQKNLNLSQSELQIIAEAIANNTNQNFKLSEHKTKQKFPNYDNSQKSAWESLDDDSINDILGKKKTEQTNQDERPVSIGCLAFILLVVFVVPVLFVVPALFVTCISIVF